MLKVMKTWGKLTFDPINRLLVKVIVYYFDMFVLKYCDISQNIYQYIRKFELIFIPFMILSSLVLVAWRCLHTYRT